MLGTKALIGVGAGALVIIGLLGWRISYLQSKVTEQAEYIGTQRAAIERASSANRGLVETIQMQRESLDNVMLAAMASSVAHDRARERWQRQDRQRRQHITELRQTLNEQITTDMADTVVPARVFDCIQAALSGGTAAGGADPGCGVPAD